MLRNAPVQISALSDIVAVAAGQFHSVALQSNGTVWAWGDNTHGEIGDGSTTQQSTPVPVAALLGDRPVAAA